MAFVEDLDSFFNEFKVNIFFENETYKGILEMPDEIVADDRVLTTDYELTVKTSELGNLEFGKELEVDNIKYKVRSTRKIDDGSLSIISLMKV
tara:strand:+ start:185 stop:463 length:279 start_codon:yes stop_codon:yes gene_type:complete